jgi:RNA polymerase sigma factor (TIGR02999 family)
MAWRAEFEPSLGTLGLAQERHASANAAVSVTDRPVIYGFSVEFQLTGCRPRARAARSWTDAVHRTAIQTRELESGHDIGPDRSLDALTEAAYHELRRVARAHLATRQNPAAGSPTLDTTALVHEAYLKLATGRAGAWRDEAHFRAVASVAMRHILVDRARMRASARHGGGLKRVTLEDNLVASDDEPETLLAIDAACARLAETSPRLARLVELRFFGGLSEQEVATELGVTVRTAQRDWAKAREFLASALTAQEPRRSEPATLDFEKPAAVQFASLWDEEFDEASFRAAIAHRYELEREIGRGGMAIVYRGRDQRDGQIIAIKVLRAATTAAGAARFRREMGLAETLRHPRILPLLDSGECNGRLWYAMPLVAGESLGARLRRAGRLPVDETIRIVAEVCEGLVVAHDRGVIHRDLKPDNILLDPHAVIADFGIAKAMFDATHGDASARGNEIRTATGVGLGTPAYMSPEQVAGVRSIDHRADLYALGVIAYEMLTGEPPFTGSSRQSVVTAHLAKQPARLSSRRPETPPPLEVLVTQLLEKDASQRPRSAFDVLQELRRIPSSSRP